MGSCNKILVVDDESLICWSLSKMLERAGYQVATANSGNEAREKFESFKPDMAILDICLPDADGLELLREFKALDEDLLVLMITAEALSESVFRAFKLGAEDYIGKPFNLDAVEEVIERAFEKRKLVKRANTFHRQLRKKFDYDQLVGTSPKMIELFKMIGVCAASDCKTVLILGESGTGKELVARAVHKQSARNDAPFIDVNCASIPKDLFESEFFGHVKGAFTGAHRDRVGRLQLADGGTLFLDEVGEIPLNQQGKLLRALQEHEFEAVGDDRTVKVDVRVVAATNHDLEKEAKAGRFREDLFYRLSVFPIEVPPLRERPEDIAALAQHFLVRSCAEMRRDPLRLSKQQVEGLQRQHWPGNIRELKNVIERAVILSKGTQTRLDLAMPDQSNANMQDLTEAADAADFVSDAQFRELEKANMIAALQHSNWRIWGSGGAAELLGLKPSTLTYRMKIFHIHKGE